MVCRPEEVAESLPLPVLARLQREAGTPFNLEGEPLVRALLIRLAPEDHLLLLNMHHTVADGWSVKVRAAPECCRMPRHVSHATRFTPWTCILLAFISPRAAWVNALPPYWKSLQWHEG